METAGSVVRAARRLHRLVFRASRAGRAAEVAAWSNGVASLGFGGGAWWLTRSPSASLGVFVLAFALLRVALANRRTLPLSAVCGTLAVAAVGGGLSWLFGHVIETAGAASIAGVLGALAASVLPAWAYGRLAQRRARNVRDSLIDVSSVSSR